MKKVFFSITVVLLCCIAMTGCIKQSRNNLTINPTMTASVNTLKFSAVTVAPSVINRQINDTTDTLIITGNANLLQNSAGDQIVLQINNFKNVNKTYSLIKGEVVEYYVHKGVYSLGTSGIVSVTNITSNSIIGYFSFITPDGYNVSNGAFTVGKP